MKLGRVNKLQAMSLHAVKTLIHTVIQILTNMSRFREFNCTPDHIKMFEYLIAFPFSSIERKIRAQSYNKRQKMCKPSVYKYFLKQLLIASLLHSQRWSEFWRVIHLYTTRLRIIYIRFPKNTHFFSPTCVIKP